MTMPSPQGDLSADPVVSVSGTERGHTHIWHFIHANTRGGWVWHCPCGAYRNNDGRVSDVSR